MNQVQQRIHFPRFIHSLSTFSSFLLALAPNNLHVPCWSNVSRSLLCFSAYKGQKLHQTTKGEDYSYSEILSPLCGISLPWSIQYWTWVYWSTFHPLVSVPNAAGFYRYLYQHLDKASLQKNIWNSSYNWISSCLYIYFVLCDFYTVVSWYISSVLSWSSLPHPLSYIKHTPQFIHVPSLYIYIYISGNLWSDPCGCVWDSRQLSLYWRWIRVCPSQTVHHRNRPRGWCSVHS